MNSQNAFFDKPTPITLPLAVATVGEMGGVSVTVDGDEFRTPNQAEHWTRARFGELLDALTFGRERAVRVEEHEIDGSVFTDGIHAVRSEQAAAEVDPPSALRRARHRHTHQLFEITGSGFIPGEDVTVALAVSSAEGSIRTALLGGSWT